MVSWYSSRWIRRLVRNLRGRADRHLRFTVVDNSGGADVELVQLASEVGDLAVVPVIVGERRGSAAHALGLRTAVDRSTSRHILLVDPDVHVFLDGWDSLLFAKMREARADVIGAPYPWWKLGKYHDFPSPVFLLSTPALLLELGNDWAPFAERWWVRFAHRACRQVLRLGWLANRRRLLALPNLARVARALERRIGVCAPDTGWLLAAAARRQGRHSVLLEEVTPAASISRWGAAKGLLCLATEFELFADGGTPVLAHRYSSAGFLWRTSGSGDATCWTSAIEAAEQDLRAWSRRRA